jgi:DNA-binding MarR family transcriptional regulator
MKLEEALKQTKPFKSEFQKLVLNIHYTSSCLNAALAEILKPFDLSPHQYNVLRILKGKYPESYCNQDITSRMIDKNSNATRIVDKLVLKKMVSRNACDEDRRQVLIKITDAGLAILDEIDHKLNADSIALTSITEEEAKLVNACLERIRK